MNCLDLNSITLTGGNLSYFIEGRAYFGFIFFFRLFCNVLPIVGKPNPNPCWNEQVNWHDLLISTVKLTMAVAQIGARHSADPKSMLLCKVTQQMGIILSNAGSWFYPCFTPACPLTHLPPAFPLSQNASLFYPPSPFPFPRNKLTFPLVQWHQVGPPNSWDSIKVSYSILQHFQVSARFLSLPKG